MSEINRFIQRSHPGIWLFWAAYALKGAKLPIPFCALFLCFCAALVWISLKNDLLIPSKEVTIPFLFFVAWTGTALFHPSVPAPYLFSLAKIVFYTAFFIFLLQLGDESTTEITCHSIVAIALLDTLVLIGKAVAGAPLNSGFLSGNMFYSALLLASALCIETSRLSFPVDVKPHWFRRFIPALLMVGLLLLRSRSVILGLLIASPLYIPRKLLFRIFLWGIMGFLLIFVFLPSTFYTLFRFHPAQTLGRPVIWKTALAATAAHPAHRVAGRAGGRGGARPAAGGGVPP